MKKTPVLVARAILGLAVVAAGSSLLSLGCHHTPPSPPPPPLSETPSTGEPTPPSTGEGSTTSPLKPPKNGGVIYVPSDHGGDDNDLAPRPAHLARSASPARDSIKELIRAPHSPIPSGTTLRGIKIEDGLATVDFSSDFQTNFHGSDTEEAQTINSVLLTLGQFPTINRVQILVEGKPIDALSQLSINEPLPVLRPQTSPTVRTVGDTP